MAKKKKKVGEKMEFRPPVVAVLGHVDHGKTSLLDKIRQTDVAGSEHGGITQKTGASKVNVDDKGWITFIDTPGHEAFSAMRARGGRVADIVVLVIAANDSVKPQTVESIEHIKKAGIPFIVAINKMDLEGANVDKVKKDLAKHDVLVEGMGGEVVVVEVSAKTGKGVKELLEMILLIAQMEKKKYDPEGELEGVVIESSSDKFKGVVATILVKRGSLRVGDDVEVEGVEGRIKAMVDEKGEREKRVGPAIAVEVLGFSEVPEIGGLVQRKGEKGKRRSFLEVEKVEVEKEGDMGVSDFFKTEEKKLKMILKAESVGCLEAVKGGLGERIEVISEGVGEITEKDIAMAKTSGGIVVGFNVKVAKNAEKMAKAEEVVVQTYKIIYKLFEEMEEVVGLLDMPDKVEEELGRAKIVAVFESESKNIAGCKVEEGKVAISDKIKIMRKDEEVARTGLESIRKVKDRTDRVDKGDECGIIFKEDVDFQIGDVVVSYKILKRRILKI